MGDYSRLLTKMAELKAIEGEYSELTNKYKPAASTTAVTDNALARDKYTIVLGKNAISDTKTPLVIRPGEDYGEFWKYIGKVNNPAAAGATNAQQINSQKCWNMAANDPRLFKQVAYTGAAGTNLGQPDWDNRCYGLTPNAPASASYNTDSPGYSHMVGNKNAAGTASGNNIYTKIGISSSADTVNISKASKLADIQDKVDYLTREIAAASGAGINSELNSLVGSAADSTDLINKINQYMNSSVSGIGSSYNVIKKRKEMNNVYAEINEQTILRARKYKFIFYIVVVISLIIGYASYTSKLSLLEQIDTIKTYVGWGWWTNWWVITIVVVIFILSSFGWDMKGNILMVIRYVTDPEFWTGQLWWVGVTFLLLLLIFFYATFKSFFMSFDAGLKNIQSSLDGDESG
jgi:hypothetical protein